MLRDQGKEEHVEKIVKIINKMSEGDRTKMKLQERPETRSSRALPTLRKVQPKISADEGELQEL